VNEYFEMKYPLLSASRISLRSENLTTWVVTGTVAKRKGVTTSDVKIARKALVIDSCGAPS